MDSDSRVLADLHSISESLDDLLSSSQPLLSTVTPVSSALGIHSSATSSKAAGALLRQLGLLTPAAGSALVQNGAIAKAVPGEAVLELSAGRQARPKMLAAPPAAVEVHAVAPHAVKSINIHELPAAGRLCGTFPSLEEALHGVASVLAFSDALVADRWQRSTAAVDSVLAIANEEVLSSLAQRVLLEAVADRGGFDGLLSELILRLMQPRCSCECNPLIFVNRLTSSPSLPLQLALLWRTSLPPVALPLPPWWCLCGRASTAATSAVDSH